jgi:hypothetical protein
VLDLAGWVAAGHITNAVSPPGCPRAAPELHAALHGHRGSRLVSLQLHLVGQRFRAVGREALAQLQAGPARRFLPPIIFLTAALLEAYLNDCSVEKA